MERIIAYLKEKYEPSGLIVYGSYMDGSNNANSDFDALVLTDEFQQKYDNSIIDGTVLDVFLYPPDIFETPFKCEDFLMLYDGRIIIDSNGMLANAKNRIIAYVKDHTVKLREEILHDIKWCEKMLLRAQRSDAEGNFRWHWVLIDSLQVYCEIRGQYYFGPKKMLRKMEQEDPEGFLTYSQALKVFSEKTLNEWICFLRKLYVKRFGTWN